MRSVVTLFLLAVVCLPPAAAQDTDDPGYVCPPCPPCETAAMPAPVPNLPAIEKALQAVEDSGRTLEAVAASETETE